MARFTNQAQLRYGNAVTNSNIGGRRNSGGALSYKNGSEKYLRTE